ncbi:hypothetical protein DFH08DRAFT_1002337 [Mycena albidolilacea]|uniref:Uncharacterized protein n=1 Tax=Mycena albidolilacea TaxID=1033008 RepID=A0AAD7A144_9AGAR|nr:hypothetical protein DFH08DRAFT_1002337 [Mycena albidolilacea]
MIPPFIATAADPTPTSYAESSVKTQSPPLVVTVSISLVAISFEGAMRAGGCSQRVGVNDLEVLAEDGEGGEEVEGEGETSALADLHLKFILAVAFGVYFYRDILPFATYTWPVQDASEDPIILRAKLITLTLAAVIIPLVTPRVYVPVDPAHPMPVPNPEQTASPLSLILFSFLDPVIVLAYKLPHLPFDLLPPLVRCCRVPGLHRCPIHHLLAAFPILRQDFEIVHPHSLGAPTSTHRALEGDRNEGDGNGNDQRRALCLHGRLSI